MYVKWLFWSGSLFLVCARSADVSSGAIMDVLVGRLAGLAAGFCYRIPGGLLRSAGLSDLFSLSPHQPVCHVIWPIGKSSILNFSQCVWHVAAWVVCPPF